MGDRETFAARWNRRKLESKKVRATTAPDAPSDNEGITSVAVLRQPNEPLQIAGTNALDAQATEIAGETPLPLLADITPEGNIAAFLHKRIPAELQKLALRKAWTSDPVISGFVEMAENQYDWNAPGGCPGFGPMDPAWDVEQLLAQATGALPKDAIVDEMAENTSPECAACDKLSQDGEPMRPTKDADATSSGDLIDAVSSEGVTPVGLSEQGQSPQRDMPEKIQRLLSHEIQPPIRRRHGGALP